MSSQDIDAAATTFPPPHVPSARVITTDTPPSSGPHEAPSGNADYVEGAGPTAVMGRSPPSNYRGRSAGGRGGRGTAAAGGSSPHHHGGRHAQGGRHLYNPQHPQPQPRAAHHRQQPQPRPAHHPQLVSIHQASGLPHGHVPAYLPGSASLVEELDAKLMVVMRDGRHLIGTLCSYDQFSNLVLENTVERRHLVVKGGQSGSSSSSSLDAPTAVYYSDIPLGLYVVRGESIVVMGRTNPAAVVGTSVDLKELEDLRQEQTADGGLDWDVDADLVA